MAKSTLYKTTKVLPGNKLELQSDDLRVGQMVEVIILHIEEENSTAAVTDQPISLAERQAFLKLPISERRQILEQQADEMMMYYEQDTE